jgi:hypothetical protein
MLSAKQEWNMTRLEQLQRDIEIIRDSIRIQRRELAAIPRSEPGYDALIVAIQSLIDELNSLLCERDQVQANATRS